MEIFESRKNLFDFITPASIAQLGERQTEDLKVTGSIPVGGSFFRSRLKICIECDQLFYCVHAMNYSL